MIAQILIPRPRITAPGTSALVAKSSSSPCLASAMESNNDINIQMISINHSSVALSDDIFFPPKSNKTRAPGRKLRKKRPIRVRQAQNSTGEGIEIGSKNNDGGHQMSFRKFNFRELFKLLRGDAAPLPASDRHNHVSLPLSSPHTGPLPIPSASNGIPPVLIPPASDRHNHISLPLSSPHIWPSPIPSASDDDDHIPPLLSAPTRPLPTSPASDLHDHIPVPPPPSPPPKGPLPNPPPANGRHNRISPPQRPLPTLPAAERVSATELSGDNGGNVVPFPSAAQLKQRMSKMKRRLSRMYRKSVGSDLEPHVGVRRDRRSGVGPSTYREKQTAKDARVASVSNWMDTDEDIDFEIDEGAVLYGILFDNYGHEYGDHSSFQLDTMEGHSQNFDAQLRQNNQLLTDALLHEILQDDERMSVGDRTSKWSESVYSRLSSILTEEKSGETRNRLLRRVESMERHVKRMGKRKAIPPLPQIPDKYKPNGIINENADSRYSFTTAGQSWNKF